MLADEPAAVGAIDPLGMSEHPTALRRGLEVDFRAWPGVSGVTGGNFGRLINKDWFWSGVHLQLGSVV